MFLSIDRFEFLEYNDFRKFMWIFPGVYHLFAAQLQICSCVAFLLPAFPTGGFYANRYQNGNCIHQQTHTDNVTAAFIFDVFAVFLQFN